MELDITLLADAIGDSATAESFREASRVRKKAINSILWNAEMQQWLDYRLTDSISSEVNIYAKVETTYFSSWVVPELMSVFRRSIYGKLQVRIRRYTHQTTSPCGSRRLIQVLK